jgi:hypothetical protein
MQARDGGDGGLRTLRAYRSNRADQVPFPSPVSFSGTLRIGDRAPDMDHFLQSRPEKRMFSWRHASNGLIQCIGTRANNLQGALRAVQDAEVTWQQLPKPCLAAVVLNTRELARGEVLLGIGWAPRCVA